MPNSLVILLGSLGFLAGAHAMTIATVTGTYVSTYDGKTYPFTINQPACGPGGICSGSYPVMIYLPPLVSNLYQMPGALRLISTMAEKGIVAATVQYPTPSSPGMPLATFLGCDNLAALAASIFAPAQGALSSVVAASREADPTRIGVVGYSLGSGVGALAVVSNPNIRAYWGLSASIVLHNFFGLNLNSPCIAEALLSVPNVRVIDGEADTWVGGQSVEPMNHLYVEYYAAHTSGYYKNPNIITTSTGGSYAITPDNTRGWYVVSDVDVGGGPNSGAANHFYWIDLLAGGTANPYWDSSTGLWARIANLNWMYNALNGRNSALLRFEPENRKMAATVGPDLRMPLALRFVWPRIGLEDGSVRKREKASSKTRKLASGSKWLRDVVFEAP